MSSTNDLWGESAGTSPQGLTNPTKHSAVLAIRPPKGTQSPTSGIKQLSPASGQEWKLSRHVQCRSFLRFKDCGRTKYPPPSPPAPRGRHCPIYPLINIKQITSHLSSASFCTSFSNLAIEASPRARLHNRDRHCVGQVGMMKSSPAADGR